MPENRQAASNADGIIEESMRRLNVGDDHEQQSPYPDRPGEPDCIYYLRTGLCGYGSNCRYNHPNYIDQGTQCTGDLPERVGQPDCQYFLKTGNCKFGVTCKYHHPRDKHDSRPVMLNIYGLPMRQDEKSCPYYMRTGSCKFGIACKFHHPQPTTLGAVFPATGPSGYGLPGSTMVTASNLSLIGGLSTWSLSRPPYMFNPRMQGLSTYMPVAIPPSQSVIPVQQGWTTYTGTPGHVPSTDVLGMGPIPNSKPDVQSGSSNQGHFPERPDQPECQYYMKTGSCRYGTSCKYHHPKERIAALTNYTLGPLGLPLRPGQAVCTFYSIHGSCKYGTACRFDHPLVGYYNFGFPTFSMPESSPIFSDQRSSQALWTPTESSASKTSKVNDHLAKPEAKNGEQDVDEEVDGVHSAQISPSHMVIEPAQDHAN